MKIQAELIEQVCSEQLHVKRELLHTRDRRDHVFLCRAAIWTLLAELLKLANGQIGDMYGFSRTNVTKAMQSFESRLQTDRKLKQRFDFSKRQILKAFGQEMV